MDIRVAAYAVITDDDGRILLAHWNEGGRSGWTLPGGGLDPGEDPEGAARREVHEETGYEVVLDGLIGVDSRVIPLTQRLTPDASGPLHALRIVYRATVTGGDARYCSIDCEMSATVAPYAAIRSSASTNRLYPWVPAPIAIRSPTMRSSA